MTTREILPFLTVPFPGQPEVPGTRARSRPGGTGVGRPDRAPVDHAWPASDVWSRPISVARTRRGE